MAKVRLPTVVQQVTGLQPAPAKADLMKEKAAKSKDECPAPNPNGTHNIVPLSRSPKDIKLHFRNSVEKRLLPEKRVELYAYIHHTLDPELEKHPVEVPLDQYWWMPVINLAAMTGFTCFFRSYTDDDRALTSDNKMISNPILSYTDILNWQKKIRRIRPADADQAIALKVIEALLGRPLWLVFGEDVDNSMDVDQESAPLEYTDEEIAEMIRTRDKPTILRAISYLPANHPSQDELWDIFFDGTGGTDPVPLTIALAESKHPKP